MLPLIPNSLRKLLWIVLSLAATLAGCGMEFREQDPAPAPDRAQRIVSLDFCADQYVLKFVERDRILAVSPDAVREFSYMRDVAAGLPTVRPVAEDVIALKPDLVVRSYGGGPRMSLLFSRAGVPVYNVRWAQDIDEIQQVIEEAARALGSPEQGLAIAEEMRTRLASLRGGGSGHGAGDHANTTDSGRLSAIANGRGGRSGGGSDDANTSDSNGASGNGDANTSVVRANVLYMTPTGVTSGPGSLIHEMVSAAGLENFHTRPGWWPIPLERLAYEQPDLLAVAFHESLADHPHVWSAIRHPVAQALLDRESVVPIDGAWTACGAWFLMDAVESLARGNARGGGPAGPAAPGQGSRGPSPAP